MRRVQEETEPALGVDGGMARLAGRTARAKALRWERAQQIGGTKEDGCGWVFWVRSWCPCAQAHVHGSREGVSSVTRRQEFPLAEPRAKQAFAWEHPLIAG